MHATDHPLSMLPDYSDFVVYADESGDHSLSSIDPEFPVFVLTFCVIRKDEYISKVVPSAQRFKFDMWGHDSVILHEIDIRKRRAPFTILLTDPELREEFFSRLTALIVEAPFEIFASVIDKRRLIEKYGRPMSPYEIALLFCMERLLIWLLRRGQAGKLAHIIFESRGAKEDRDLEIEFRRICSNTRNWGWRSPDFRRMQFEPVFVKKSANSTGLQVADLTARPIAINMLRPNQANRAYEVIAPKIAARKEFP